jgi:hypothetical protein
MAKLNQITIGGKLAIEVNADPSAGLIAPIGSFALFSDTGVGKLYLKVGASDTSWSLVTTDGAIDLTPYFKHDGSVSMTGGINTSSAIVDLDAVGTNFVALGSNNTVSGSHAVAMGEFNTASGNYSVVMGQSNSASGEFSVAMGSSNSASGEASVAMGRLNTASGTYAVAMGKSNIVSGNRSFAMGKSNIVYGADAFAMGCENAASGNFSFALGSFTTARSFHQTTIGCGDLPLGGETPDSWVTTDPLFVIGNSPDGGDTPSNALVILKNAKSYFKNDMDLGSHQIKNLLDGTDAQDAVSLSQLSPYLKHDGTVAMTGDFNVANHDIVAVTNYNSYVVGDYIFTDDSGSLLMTFGSESSNFPFKILGGAGTPPSNFSFDVVYYAIVVSSGVYHVSNTGFSDTLLSYIDSGTFSSEAYVYTLGEMSLRASQVNLENHKIVGIANAVSPQDVPSLSQVEGLISAIPSVDLEPFLKHDGSVPMTGDFDFAGFEAVAVSEISHFKKFTEVVGWEPYGPYTVITLTFAHTLAEKQGAPCKFTVGSILPPEFNTSTTYYAKALTQSVIQLEASVGGGFITYSAGGGIASLEFLGSDLKVSSDLNLQSNKIKNLIDPVSAQDASTKNYADTRDALYLPLAGGTMSSAIAMGTNKITGLDNGTLPDHAINLSQLQAAIGGLFWLNPCLDPDLVDDSAVQATVEALTPVDGDVYIASASGSTWVSGHAYFWDGSVWVDLLGRAVLAGDRFGVSVETATVASSGLVGKDNFVAEIVSVGPIVWSFHSPNDQEAFFVNNELSTHFGHSYTYFGTAWIEFGGISALNAGAGLDLSGNILSVNCGAGIQILPTDEVGIDLYSASALELVDPSTGLPSLITDAQLSLKLDSIGYATLSKSVDGIRVANGGIKNTQVASDASIAYSKLDLALSIVNADVSTTAAIAFSKLASLTEAHILVGSATGVATDVAMSGEASIIASGAVTLSNSAVIAKTLTAYTAGAGTVSNADSILSAIQKLDGNIKKLPILVFNESPAGPTQNIVISGFVVGVSRIQDVYIVLNGDTYSAVWEKMVHIDSSNTLVLAQDGFTSLNVASAGVTVVLSMSGADLQIDFAGLSDTGMTIKVLVEQIS